MLDDGTPIDGSTPSTTSEPAAEPTPPTESASEPSGSPEVSDVDFWRSQAESFYTEAQRLQRMMGQTMQQPKSEPAPATGGRLTPEQLAGYDPVVVAMYQGIMDMMDPLSKMAQYQETMRHAAQQSLTQEESTRTMDQFNNYTSKAFQADGLPTEGRMGQLLTQGVMAELERMHQQGYHITRPVVDRTIKLMAAEAKKYLAPKPTTPPRTSTTGGPVPDPNQPMTAQERRMGVMTALQGILTT